MLKPKNMSADETDQASVQRGILKTFVIIVSEWQSDELKNFVWGLDRKYAEHAMTRPGGGNRPRVRVLREGARSEAGYPPAGLWRNCYDPVWLAKQPPYERHKLYINDEDYNFDLTVDPNDLRSDIEMGNEGDDEEEFVDSESA